MLNGGTISSAEDEIDISALLSSIRAKYRLLCTSLGIRPRLAVAPSSSTASEDNLSEGVVVGIEGPMKGVDTRQLRY